MNCTSSDPINVCTNCDKSSENCEAITDQLSLDRKVSSLKKQLTNQTTGHTTHHTSGLSPQHPLIKEWMGKRCQRSNQTLPSTLLTNCHNKCTKYSRHGKTSQNLSHIREKFKHKMKDIPSICEKEGEVTMVSGCKVKKMAPTKHRELPSHSRSSTTTFSTTPSLLTCLNAVEDESLHSLSVNKNSVEYTNRELSVSSIHSLPQIHVSHSKPLISGLSEVTTSNHRIGGKRSSLLNKTSEFTRQEV